MTKKDKIAKRLAEQLIQEGIVKPDEVDECLALTKEALVKQMGETRKSTTQLLSEPAEAVENKESLINDIYERGRSLCQAGVSRTVWTKRNAKRYPNGGNSGFQALADERIRQAGFNDAVFQPQAIKPLQWKFGFTGGINQKCWNRLTTKDGISSLVALVDVTDNSEKPIPLSRFTKKTEDNVPAYQLLYFVMGNEKQHYNDTVTNRYGNYFLGSIFLTRELGERAIQEIQQDPQIAREIVRKFEPDVLEEQESIDINPMPDDTKLAVIPLGKHDEALEYEEGTGRAKKPIGIKKDYVVEVE